MGAVTIPAISAALRVSEPYNRPAILPVLRLEVAMPRYEFFCEDCQKPFEIILTLAEYEKDRIACPHVHQEAPKCSGTASANRNATESESCE